MNHPHKALPPWRHVLSQPLPLMLIVIVILLLCTVSAIAWLDYRMGQTEERRQHLPPSTYKSPDLAHYSAAEIDTSTLTGWQTIYVPVYSHVYYQGGIPALLETTLSIRNTDPAESIFVASVEYYDTDGKLVTTYLDQTIRLTPLQTIEFLVAGRETTGGSGANFLLQWTAEQRANPPLVEAVMVGTSANRAFAFTRSGVSLQSRGAPDPPPASP